MNNILIYLTINKPEIKGCIPWVEQRNAMPHTAVLPLNYIHLLIFITHYK